MGLLRVLLALAVLLGHTGGLALPGGVHLPDGGAYLMTGGPVAVQAFFLVSGFYMGLVLNERYATPADNVRFWKARAIRIYALYFAFLALYLGAFWVAEVQGGRSPLSVWSESPLPLYDKLFLALLNLTVVGQDLTLYLAEVHGHFALTGDGLHRGGAEVFRFMAIPMAWSLSLELTFYAIAPFLVRRPTGQIAAMAALSLAARVAAALAGWDADPFSYRFFPFELALFLGGVLAYRAWKAWPGLWDGRPARLLALMAGADLLAYPWLLGDWSDKPFFTPARVGTLLLLACALPAIHAWTRNDARDRRLGELSYPLYLSHFLVLGAIGGIGPLASNLTLRTLAVALVSLLVSWAVVRFVDAPVEAWRRRVADGTPRAKPRDIAGRFA